MNLVYAGSGIGNIVLATPVCKALGETDLCIGLPSEVPGIEKLFDIPSVRRVITTGMPDKEYDKIILTRWFHPHYFPHCPPGNIKGDKWFVGQNDSIHEITNNLHAVGGGDFTPEVNYVDSCFNDEKTVGIHAGGKSEGSWISKRWDKYEELIHSLWQEGYEPVLFGAGNDDNFPDLVYHNYFDKLDIYEAARIINACDHFISNDTGLMHIRAAMGKPQIAIVCGLGHDRWSKNDISFYNAEAKFISKKDAKDISVEEVLNLLEE